MSTQLPQASESTKFRHPRVSRFSTRIAIKQVSSQVRLWPVFGSMKKFYGNLFARMALEIKP